MKFLDHDAVNLLIGPRSRVQRWRDVKTDLFPRHVLIGGRQRWPDTDIALYQQWRLAVRDGATTAAHWSEWLAEQAEKAAA
jgi:predicted DNA-binding transcriptional regulator AlpA